MKETEKELAICSKDHSILLKELGFDWKVDNIYKQDYEPLFRWHGNAQKYGGFYPAPTVALAIQWLDSKGIYIETESRIENGNDVKFTVHFTSLHIDGKFTTNYIGHPLPVVFTSRPEAYSAGLTHSLQYLKSRARK